jgi:hypothetical protein
VTNCGDPAHSAVAPLDLDRARHLRGHRPAPQHQRPAREEGREREDLVADVVDHRQEDPDHEVALDAQPAAERHREVQPREVARAVREHHALGHRRRAGGEQQLPDVVTVDLDVGLGDRPPLDELGERRAARDGATADRDGGPDGQPPGGERLLRARPQLGVDDRERRLGAGDQVLEHVRGQRGVQRHRDHPGLGDADLGDVGLDGVLAEQQHPRRRLQAAFPQRVRHLVGELVGLPEGQRPVALVGVRARPAGDRDLVRVAPREPFQHVADRGPLPPVDGAAAPQVGDVDVARTRLHGASISAARAQHKGRE